MTKTDDRKKTSGGIPLKTIGIGTAIAIVVTLAILLLGAMLISSEKVPETICMPLILFAAFAGAFCGGLFAAKKNQRAFVPCGLIVGAVLFLIRMAAAAFGSPGQILDSSAFWMLAAFLFGGVLGGLLAGKKRRRRKK